MTITHQLEKAIELFESMPRIKFWVSTYVKDFNEDGKPFLAKMEETKFVVNSSSWYESRPTGTDILIMSPDTARLLAESVGGNTGRELVRLADNAIDRAIDAANETLDAILDHNPAN